MSRNKKRDLFEYLREIYQLKTDIVTDYNKFEKVISIDNFINKYSSIVSTKKYFDNLSNEEEVFQLKYIKDNISMPQIPEELKKYVNYFENKVELKPNKEQSKEILKLFNQYQKKWEEINDKNKLINEYNEYYKYLAEVNRRKEEYEEKLEIVYCKGLLIYQSENIKGTNEIKRHVFEMPLTILLNQDTNVLKLKINREERCKIDTTFLSVINGFEAKNEKALIKLNDEINNLFSEYETIEFEKYFKKYLNDLSFNGKYLNLNDEEKIEPNKFYIKNEDCIIIRKKQPTIWIEELNRIIQIIDENGSFNSENKIIDLVLEDKNSERIDQLITSKQDKSRILFPLPANDEQYRVVEKLQDSNLVLVQGPPGTGKSHTICNLISTYVANGKKILVTSEKSKALEVVKEKLPEKIRNLSMTILNENKNDKELADSISFVLEKFKDKEILNQYEDRISTLEQKLDKIEDKILANKEELLLFLENNTKSYESQIKEIIPENTTYMLGDLAKYLKENSKLDKITDRNEFSKIQFQEEFLHDYGKICDNVKENSYIAKQILPEIKEFSELEENLNKINLYATNENLKIFANQHYAFENQIIDKIIENIKVIQNVNVSLDKEFILENKNYKPRLNNVKTLIELCEKDREFLEKIETNMLGVQIVYDQEASTQIQKILQDMIPVLREKKKLGFFDKIKFKEALEKIQIVTIEGKKLDPNNLNQLEILQGKIEYDLKVKDLKDKIEKTLTFTKMLDMKENEISRYLDDIIKVSKLFLDYEVDEIYCSTNITKIFANNEEIIRLWENKEFEKLMEVFSHVKEYQKYQVFKQNYEDILKKIVQKTENCKEIFEPILTTIEKKDWDTYKFQKEQLEKMYEIDRQYKRILNVYKSELEQYSQFITEFEEMTPEARKEIIQDWNIIFHYYKVKMLFLEEISKNVDYHAILKEKEKLQKDKNNIMINLLEEQAWYHQIKNMNNLIANSLSRWITLKQKLGKGTGKKANLIRKAMQAEMKTAKDAIPIWIMPVDKVVEQYPFCENPQFDLVIMDESSQSSIITVSALLRGKKNVIVGDDQQISPHPVGIEVKELKKLQSQYLSGTHLMSFLDNETSIYDGIQSICGSRKVVLKEHFRCLPEIIEFSNMNFYSNKINCLKVRSKENTIPQAIKTEFVENASVVKKGNHLLNVKEIDRIIEMIKEIEKDSRYQNKTIGIIVLQNSELQLHYLNDQLQANFSLQFRKERKLKIGTTYDFQGDERDVIILSMIVSKNYEVGELEEEKTIRPLTRGLYGKSFNVAASRAKEQVILVHSVMLQDLNSEDYRYKLLSYYMGNNPVKENNKEINFNSDFEKDVYEYFSKEGILLTPHYKVGKYLLDFVIENEFGTKIAIECDGDIYKTIQEYEEEIKKQNVLERCGWSFIRIIASNYYYDQANTIFEVMNKIKKIFQEQKQQNNRRKEIENQESIVKKKM